MTKKAEKPRDLAVDDLEEPVTAMPGDLPADETPTAPDVAAATSAAEPPITATDLPADETPADDLVEAAPLTFDPDWKPGSCINCGQTNTDDLVVFAPGRYGCKRCKHKWTAAEEQAPFRRLAH